MIIRVEGKRVRLDPATQEFIESLTEQNGTPANEVIAAILNGQLGRF